MIESTQPGQLLDATNLMSRYSNTPMDFADATLVTSAEARNVRSIFTLDFADFRVYRVRRGHRLDALELLGRQGLE